MTDQTEALATLDQLAALGMDLARAITAQGLESSDPASVASAFAKVSHSVRQTILLKDRLIKGINYDRSQRRMRRRIQLEDALNDIIDQEAQDSLDYERLHTEAAERLEFEDDDPLADLPFDEAFPILCKDLGLDPSTFPLWREHRDATASDIGGTISPAHLSMIQTSTEQATSSGPGEGTGIEAKDGPPPPDD